VRNLNYPNRIVVFWNYLHRVYQLMPHMYNHLPEFKGLHLNDIIAQAFRKYLGMRPDIQTHIDVFQKLHYGNPTIGIHVRYSDRKTNLSAYKAKVEKVLSVEPNATIFLATDNRQVLEDYQGRYSKVISTPKWYPDSSETMHYGASCPNRFQNGVNALVDIMLLSRCNYLIYSGQSTFSYLSRVLSGLPMQRVVDIDRINPVVRLKNWVRNHIP
jgi:hypothetical protein